MVCMYVYTCMCSLSRLQAHIIQLMYCLDMYVSVRVCIVICTYIIICVRVYVSTPSVLNYSSLLVYTTLVHTQSSQVCLYRCTHTREHGVCYY
jgi:hypothetical protein